MKKFNSCLNEYNETKLKFSAFDWDDNILNMSTKIHLEELTDDGFKEIKISTSEYATKRQYIVDIPEKSGDLRYIDSSFDEFKDRNKSLVNKRSSISLLIVSKDLICSGVL